LGKELNGNVMRIAPLAVLRQEHKESLENQKDVELLEPLITEAIGLSFSRVEEIQKMIDAGRGAGNPGSGNEVPGNQNNPTIMSPRGSYILDSRTNTLIVTDTAQGLSNVKRFIALVDKATEQVLIEARIVEATDSFTNEFGIRWGGQTSTQRTGLDGSPNIQVGSTNPTASDGFLVDLPAAAASSSGGAIGLSWSAISKAINLDLELSAAEINGEAKIISSPRILTANGGTALISQGSDVPFVTPSSAAGPATVTFKKAELKLEVTPQITANDTVIMEVDISKDAPTGQSVQGNPILSTKKVTSTLQVKDGETIVIGGIYTRDKSTNTSGVPGFKDIPVLGWLFKTQGKTDNKTELLIFLTPSIVQGDADT
ncbi:MAG: type IV pilus secretin PilQ, partial [Mariprofundaceae bacterium]|nr:type IV pilus secretin PilQ [Mariprofundaceae bacterium]